MPAICEVPVSRRVDAAFVGVVIGILVISPATVGLIETCSSGPPSRSKCNGRGRTVTREVWSADKVTLGQNPVLDLFDGPGGVQMCDKPLVVWH